MNANVTLEILADAVDTAWVIACATFVVMMQLGFAMLEAGTVNEHNVIATFAKNILDFLVGTITAATFGYALANGAHPLLSEFQTRRHHIDFFFYLCFQATAATIVSGAMAERTSVAAYLVLSIFVSGGVYASAVRCAWTDDGVLATMNPPFHDFAGSGVVHLVGGMAAAVGAWVVGPRAQRWAPAHASKFVPHDVPSVMGGTMLLWVGWYGFNTGSTGGLSTTRQQIDAANCAMTTTLAGATGGVFAALPRFVRSRGHTLDVLAVSNGLLGGLVSITAGCDCIEPRYALVVGAVGGLVYAGGVALRTWLRVDDVVDAFAVHGCCGAWGCIAVGLLHPTDGLLYCGRVSKLASQLAGVGLLTSLAVAPTLALTLALQRARLLRVSADREREGLDAEFGLRAYVRRSEQLLFCEGVSQLLREHGHTSSELLEALVSLRTIIHRPLSPQAGDNKLEGEVKDILSTFETSGPAAAGGAAKVDGGQLAHLAFLSHHKADAGDACRIFADTARRLLSHQGAERPTSQPADGWAAQLNELHGLATQIGPIERAFYLDSNALTKLKTLLVSVELSRHYVLFLSRSVLRRPWVLAELTRAHASGRSMHTIMLDYPARADDPKTFRFPEDLESAISEWSWYALQEGGKSASDGGGARASRRPVSRKLRGLAEAASIRRRTASRPAERPPGAKSAGTIALADEDREAKREAAAPPLGAERERRLLGELDA